jgi:flagella basal body P-ring formation protein FlgA
MHLTVNGQPYRTIPLWFNVEANRSVAVADADMPAGESLRPEKFSSRVVDVTQFTSEPVLPESIAPTMRLRQPLARGTPLLGVHVESRPHVTRNQAVEVKVVAGPIRIETTGVALTDARIGELVRVRNPASKEPPFSAKVVDEGVVLIQAR